MPDDVNAGLDGLAERYVRLVLAIGEHDANMVDAYYGPPQWREDARAHKRSLEELDSDARDLADALAKLAVPDDLSALRRRALGEQLASIRARLEILRGTRMSFDEEARRIYGVAPPHHDDDFYRAVHRQLDAVVPGTGPLRERMDAFKKKFVVPRERIKSVIDPALEACRGTTLRHIAMPDGENFRLELVTDKPWGAYNWFQGNYQSLIEVNVSLPFYAGQAAKLMCHEGYPGHHVLNSLLEQKLVRERGWIEYTIYPLYSAESLIAEGTADFGFGLVFPGDTGWQWERDRLYPIAGIDPALAEVRLPGQRVEQGVRLRRDRRGARLSRRSAVEGTDDRMAAGVHVRHAQGSGTAPAVLRDLPLLHRQLSARRGSRRPVHRPGGGHGSGCAVEGICRPARLAARRLRSRTGHDARSVG